MLCLEPFKVGVAEYRCGKCASCRMRVRRMWTLRLVLESTQHQASLCSTLTYEPGREPEGMRLSVRDAQLFIKRVRRAVAPERVRYYLVGEYGSRTRRPHYHACLFGLRYPDVVSECWDGGFSQVRPFDVAGAAYVAGYVTKKVNDVDEGFRLMSLKPGIGGGATDAIARGMVFDVPTVLRFQGKLWPVAQYLRRRVGEVHGIAAVRKTNIRRRYAYDARLDQRRAELSEPGARGALEDERFVVGTVVDGQLRRWKLKEGL